MDPKGESPGGSDALVVPVDALVALVTFLRLEGKGRDGPRFEALEGDRLAGLLAIAVGASSIRARAASILAISLR